MKHGWDLEQNYRPRQQCEKEQRGKNNKDTYGGQGGDSLNRVVALCKRTMRQVLEMVGEGQMLGDLNDCDK